MEEESHSPEAPSDPWSSAWDSIAPAVEERAPSAEAASDPWSSAWDSIAPAKEPEAAAIPETAADPWGDEADSAVAHRRPEDGAETASGHGDQPEPTAAPAQKSVPDAGSILMQFNEKLSKLSVVERMKIDGFTVMEISLDELKAQIEAERVHKTAAT